jgi:hypothetical protein
LSERFQHPRDIRKAAGFPGVAGLAAVGKATKIGCSTIRCIEAGYRPCEYTARRLARFYKAHSVSCPLETFLVRRGTDPDRYNKPRTSADQRGKPARRGNGDGSAEAA